MLSPLVACVVLAATAAENVEKARVSLVQRVHAEDDDAVALLGPRLLTLDELHEALRPNPAAFVEVDDARTRARASSALSVASLAAAVPGFVSLGLGLGAVRAGLALAQAQLAFLIAGAVLVPLSLAALAVSAILRWQSEAALARAVSRSNDAVWRGPWSAAAPLLERARGDWLGPCARDATEVCAGARHLDGDDELLRLVEGRSPALAASYRDAARRLVAGVALTTGGLAVQLAAVLTLSLAPATGLVLGLAVTVAVLGLVAELVGPVLLRRATRDVTEAVAAYNAAVLADARKAAAKEDEARQPPVEPPAPPAPPPGPPPEQVTPPPPPEPVRAPLKPRTELDGPLPAILLATF